MTKKADFVVDGDATKDAQGKSIETPAGQEMKTIVIHPKGPDDPLFQPVAVNGKTWVIRKGVEAKVPWFVLEALKNAVETHFVESRHGGDICYEDRQSPRMTIEVRHGA